MATRKTVNEYFSQCSLTSTLNILSSGGSVFRLHGLGSRDFKTIDRVVIAAAGRRRGGGLMKINGTEPELHIEVQSNSCYVSTVINRAEMK